jgi:hypothetical protein
MLSTSWTHRRSARAVTRNRIPPTSKSGSVPLVSLPRIVEDMARGIGGCNDGQVEGGINKERNAEVVCGLVELQ